MILKYLKVPLNYLENAFPVALRKFNGIPASFNIIDNHANRIIILLIYRHTC